MLLCALAFDQSCRKLPFDGLAEVSPADSPGASKRFGTKVVLMDGMAPPSLFPPGIPMWVQMV